MRRYPQRKPKNYAWDHQMNQGGPFDVSSVLALNITTGGTIEPTGQGSRGWNLQRIVGDVVIGIGTDDLEDSTAILHAAIVAWAVGIWDSDDTTIYDPGLDAQLVPETILAHGYTDRFGWGTVNYGMVAGTGTGVSQTAAFWAQTRLHLDIRTNRKFSNDKQARLLLTCQDLPNLTIASGGTGEYFAAANFRSLHKLP